METRTEERGGGKKTEEWRNARTNDRALRHKQLKINWKTSIRMDEEIDEVWVKKGMIKWKASVIKRHRAFRIWRSKNLYIYIILVIFRRKPITIYYSFIVIHGSSIIQFIKALSSSSICPRWKPMDKPRTIKPNSITAREQWFCTQMYAL